MIEALLGPDLKLYQDQLFMKPPRIGSRQAYHQDAPLGYYLAPPEMVGEMGRLFEESGAAGELEVHPDVHHGFAFPERWCYDKPAAERHWERLIALYRRCLD